jgi:ketosteroid isomerase-like protein
MKHDMDKLKEVVSEDVTWYFLGRHRLAGVKRGLKELVEFFDTMGAIMKESRPSITKLIVAENDDYVIECQHIKTNREDGINIEHHATVLWTIKNGRIISGRHFFADPEAVDDYFNTVPLPGAQRETEPS